MNLKKTEGEKKKKKLIITGPTYLHFYPLFYLANGLPYPDYNPSYQIILPNYANIN